MYIPKRDDEHPYHLHMWSPHFPYKDRATLLMTQTLQVVQGRTPNHLDLLLNLRWTLVCRNPSSWSSSYREGARERYQCLQSTKREARIKVRQVHTKVFIISTFVFFGIQNIEKRRNNMESLNSGLCPFNNTSFRLNLEKKNMFQILNTIKTVYRIDLINRELIKSDANVWNVCSRKSEHSLDCELFMIFRYGVPP